MQTSVHIVTPSNVRILLRRKGKVSLTPKRNTESIEIEKMAEERDCRRFSAGKEVLFVDSKVS